MNYSIGISDSYMKPTEDNLLDHSILQLYLLQKQFDRIKHGINRYENNSQQKTQTQGAEVDVKGNGNYIGVNQELTAAWILRIQLAIVNSLYCYLVTLTAQQT
jgi:hypothetical protein